MQTRICCFIPFLLLLTILASAQEGKSLRVMFYNVENLFDTEDDSLTMDEEFLPGSDRHWNKNKFYKKLNNIYKVIIGVGEWEPPAIIGLCEIENRFVLNQLVYHTPLEKFGYEVVHYESPDRRGIDVACIYRKDKIVVDTTFPIRIDFSFDPTSTTRDILYIKGAIGLKDTFHLFVNHWPSRYGGYLETIPKRKAAAGILRQFTDSLLQVNAENNIIIMGDFNDDPLDQSLQKELMVKTDTLKMNPMALYDMASINTNLSIEGTLKFQEGWNIFDQIIVSGNLLQKDNGLRVRAPGYQIYSPDFLLVEDEKNLGKKPFRTYNGFKYEGGYSDHLPVYMDILYKE
ncbi:MAG: endonuclease [Bacteroidales bacterium]|nr:endonuclease [Bacteroidales bacterium]MCF8404180.1 endonuclease [Bacteroidales bacterium]